MFSKNISLILFLAFLWCSFSSLHRDESIVKSAWNIDLVTGDSCIAQRTFYLRGDTVIRNSYNYYDGDCEGELLYKSVWVRGKIISYINYENKSLEPYQEYSYLYNEDNILVSFGLKSKSLNIDEVVQIKSEFDSIGLLKVQKYYYDTGDFFREIIYVWNEDELVSMEENDLSRDFKYVIYYEKGKKVKSVTNGSEEIWEYKDTLLTKYIKNKYESDLYYYESNLLIYMENAITRKSGISTFIKEEYEYFDNDSIMAKRIYDNNGLKRLVKYHYEQILPK